MFHRRVAAFAVGLLLAAPAVGQCNGGCAVGALGTGGLSSQGSAQGFRYVGPGPLNPANTLTNDGLSSAGHVQVTDGAGNVIGTLNGRCGEGSLIWTGTGSGIFGDWAGSSEIDWLPCD